MKRTGKNNRYVQTAVTALLTVGIIGASSANPTFPPNHLHRSARFVAPIMNPYSPSIPWYYVGAANARERLVAEEIRTSAPLSSNHYFLTMRLFGNPAPYTPDAFNNADILTEVEVVRDSVIGGNES